MDVTYVYDGAVELFGSLKPRDPRSGMASGKKKIMLFLEITWKTVLLG